MNGLLTIAWKVFLFVMVITCWKQLTRIGIEVLKIVADLVWTFFDRLHGCVKDHLRYRKDS